MNTALALTEDDNKPDHHRRARPTASSRPKPYLYLAAAHGRLLREAEEDETNANANGNRAGRITKVISHTTTTSKELDEETGLYYFGARYYDPRTSVWQSADPALGRYVPSLRGQKLNRLPGGGGVYNPINLAMYSYAHANPIVAKDPDGKHAIWAHKAILEEALQGKYGVSDYAMKGLKAGTEKADTCPTCQGNRAEQANLHGMAAFVTGEDGKQRVQTRAEAIEGTQAAIDKKIAEAVSLASEKKYDEALEALAAGTHAAQDADQHGYEEWTFSGLWDFVMSDPVGAIVHWFKDNWLGGEEKSRNAKITQGVIDKFREKAGDQLADSVLNYSGNQGHGE